MTDQMIFVPLARQDAQAMRDGQISPVSLLAYTATPELMKAGEFDASMTEDADFQAQTYAALAFLVTVTADPVRLVLAIEVPSRQVRPVEDAAAYGAVIAGAVDWSAVRAVFVDEPAAAAAVLAARTAIAEALPELRPGGGGPAAEQFEGLLGLAEVVELTEQHDLLWHLPDEQW